LKKVTSSIVSGKFIEEKTFIKEITNPFGVTETISIPDFNIIEFSITKIDNNWLLEIYDTPRSIKPLTKTLGNLLGMGFYVENIDLDLENLVKKIENDIGKLNITKMELYNINIQNIALGQMLVTSQKDVRKSLDSYLLNNKGYNIHSITAKFNYHELFTGSLEIKSSSRTSISDMPFQLFLKSFMPIFLSSVF
jgi:hypothetical protein